ncbi:hypothetical protein LOTGIDRAFT_171653 [Lottia gigantea]|uniref:EF-hand domain-containing protein n=1 Tax=Lottia gigantea TaxID=225164 RepID=V4CLJ7_LOTGI|nr:hypothetical protein LOTGIDRAFT_171653 [Lottia gigantea]ESP03180.1 hypothetical protein LOTGIDRAFT_171653 [Lottia gigantea]
MADQECNKQGSEDTNDDTNVNLLKQEAENGSGEHQYELGKRYLKLADSEINRDENISFALHWLVKSSKQGNEDATKELQKCMEDDIGINEENGPDIRWCIQTSSLEKQIRHASARLFQSLNTTHKNTISKDEYMKAIKSLPGQKQQKLLMAAGWSFMLFRN